MKAPLEDRFKEYSVAEYLDNTQTGTVTPPLPVHSTIGRWFLTIMKEGRLKATDCNVFLGEKLTYLFIGRPSYKPESKNTEGLPWMMPVVFILKSLEGLPIKRIFPLDTGAFSTKRLPEYITVFQRDMFSLGTDPAQIGRVIASFYETSERYMSGENLSLGEIKRRVTIDIRHAAVQALITLCSERSLETIDDRGRNIEVQVEADIPLEGNVVGVVAPDVYKLGGDTKAYFQAIGAEVEFYRLHPFSPSHHYAAIYDAVEKIMKDRGS